MSAHLGLCCVLFAPLLLAADAPDVSRPARGAIYSIRYAPAADLKAGAVEVAGIDRNNLSRLAHADWSAERWAELLAVSVAPPIETTKTATPSILGSYKVAGALLRFEPRFPIEPGLRHRVRFRPALLPEPGQGLQTEVVAEFTRPARSSQGPTSVVHVDPASAQLPENLLKFYLHFSAPMSRGGVYQRVSLIDESGRKVDRPFLELGEELWDRSGTRITILLDPGRIKRGLKPREEEGPILQAGHSYTLVIDRAWPDAEGNPLRDAYRKRFVAGPPDDIQPNPKTWKLSTPGAETRDPLAFTFPEPLDSAILQRALVVVAPDGKPVPGQVKIDGDATRWRYQPDGPWRAGTYRVLVDTTLEDLAGNSIARPFEIDVFHPVGQRIEAETISIPVTISTRPRP